ncbi:hypothetical protein ACWEP4_40860, partial [Streptomyces sp. NPDC004227]
MGIALLVVLTAVVAAAVVTGLVRAGRREAQAERTRLAEEARRQARRSLDAVWAMDDRQFEEYVAELCRRSRCSRRRIGGPPRSPPRPWPRGSRRERRSPDG